MKVLWLSHLIPYPPKGGVLQRSFNMIREIAKYHDVTLVAFDQSDFLRASLPHADNPLEVARSELLKSVKAFHILDIPENSMPGGRYLIAIKALLSGDSYNMQWLRSVESFRFIDKLLSVQDFDVIHLDTISLCVFFDVFKSGPVVLNHHNFESGMLKARAETERNWVKSFYYGIEARRLLKSEIEYCQRSDINLTCSSEDSEAMKKKIGSARFYTVPNGVDISYFYPNESIEIMDKSIVIVGGLSWYPNREAVEYFIREIWPIIKKQIPGMRVDIVGRSPTSEMLQLAAEDEMVYVHGFVDDVREYIWRSQFYLCPIRTGGGTKLKILDALASGACIIADPFACKGIEVREGVDVVYAEHPQEYVDQIRHLLDNPEMQAKLRASGPKLIQKLYSYDKIGKDYSSVLNKLATTGWTQGGRGL